MKKILFVLIGVCCSNFAFGQYYLGTATSNWSGISALYLNPANIADNRDRLVIDLAGFNVAVDNSLGKINANPGISRFISGGENNINDVFTFSDKTKFSLLAPYIELKGPGVMFKITHNQSIAITTRVRGVNQLNNFDQSLYRSITDSAYAHSGNLDLVAQNFNWTAHLWAEAAVTYGAVALEKGRSEIKVGVTGRYLDGVAFLGIKGRNLDLHYLNSADSFYAKNTDIEYASNILSATSALTNGISGSQLFNNFLQGKGGKGVGGDIGIVYDYLENGNDDTYDMDGKTGISNQARNRYKFRVSAAVTDLGFINYSSNNNYAVNVSGNGDITGAGFSAHVTNFNTFTSYVQQQGFHADTTGAANKVYMPAMLHLQVDYHAWKCFYVNAAYFDNLVNIDANNFGNTFYNQLSITPRYDTRRFSVGLPISYSWLSETMKLGIGFRYSGFYIGSDDMLAVFHNEYGMNIYMGGFIPFGNKKPKDRDGDHVSDRKDRCPDDYGEWENHGCPIDEKERDKAKGKADTADDCPEAHGLAPMHTGSNKKSEVTIAWHKGKTPVSKTDYQQLSLLAKELRENPEEKLLVEGYAGKSSLSGSAERMETIANYFTGKGINRSRISTLGEADGRRLAVSRSEGGAVVRLVD